MQIIDAQVHIWGSGSPSGHHRQTSIYTAEELLKEQNIRLQELHHSEH